MSKYKTMLKKDIQLCDEYIAKNFATHGEVKSLTGKYIMDYPKFNEGIISYVGVPVVLEYIYRHKSMDNVI